MQVAVSRLEHANGVGRETGPAQQDVMVLIVDGGDDAGAASRLRLSRTGWLLRSIVDRSNHPCSNRAAAF
ncbi:hypothetical protein ACFPQ7_20670, partial [Methylobacterium iners]|uniref:hypothetical protein n=1 Tax=Methylobacterium iners TaxID=418707 RepID=UPI00361C9EB4